jgi:hypothetical protein
MEINTVSVAQSNVIRDVGPSVLDKSLNQKEEQALGIGNHGREVENTKSDDSFLGQNIDLFT